MAEPYQILHSCCLEAMRAMPEASVDAVVTDPPYELAFMGKGWDSSGIAFDPQTWREALRVLKPGGHLVAFNHSRTWHRMTVAIEDAGFEIRDSLMWIYGSGFPKSHNMDGAWAGWGSALKPAFEPIVLARKPLIGTIAANVLAHGTGALNIDGCRIRTSERLSGSGNKPLSYGGDNHRPYHDREPRGPTQQHEAGRWPANLVHDGSDEVLEAFARFPSSGNNWRANKQGKATHTVYGDGISGTACHSDTGTAARFFFSGKATKEDRAGSSHPTVKPIALMRWLCRLVTPPGGTILDPFAGSGTTGAAALREGFRPVLIEREAEYVADIRRRMEVEQERSSLPAEAVRQLDLLEVVA